MKTDLSNSEIARVTELPDGVRIPLHSLQADLGYLIGRVIADGSCGPMVVKSMKERLDQIESEIKPLYAAPPSPDRAPGWQPIETAPKDGNTVVVWDAPVKGEAYYDISEGLWWWANTGRGDYTAHAIYPTLWHPMPADPPPLPIRTGEEG